MGRHDEYAHLVHLEWEGERFRAGMETPSIKPTTSGTTLLHRWEVRPARRPPLRCRNRVQNRRGPGSDEGAPEGDIANASLRCRACDSTYAIGDNPLRTGAPPMFNREVTQ